MRAAVVNQAGETPAYGTFEDPAPRPGGETYELVAAGIHQVVRATVGASHYGASGIFPQIPGVDAVARRADGTLVYTGGVRAPYGTFAELLATPLAVPLPDGADPLAVAAGTNPAMSGWLPLAARRDEIGTLGTVLVLGATGMAGRLAVQSARSLGATRVVGAGRDPQRLDEVAALGAEPVALADDPSTSAAALVAALGDDAPSIVLDYVWGPVAEAAFAALQRRGMDEDTADVSYVQIGSLGGATAALPSSLLRARRIRVSGSGAGSLSTQQLLAELPVIHQRIADGTLHVPYRAFPLSDVASAWAHHGPERAVVVPG